MPEREPEAEVEIKVSDTEVKVKGGAVSFGWRSQPGMAVVRAKGGAGPTTSVTLPVLWGRR